MERARVGEAGELVGDRLALDRLVQGRVLDRHDGLPGQVLEQLLLLAREAPRCGARSRGRPGTPARRPDQRPHRDAPARGPRRPGRVARAAGGAAARRRGRAARAAPGRPRPRPRTRAARRRRWPRSRPRVVACPTLRLAERVRASSGRARPASASQASTACAHGQRDDAVAVEPGGERVADAPDRLLELPALALDLLDLGLELRRHAVELASELGELVVALRPGPDGRSRRGARRRAADEEGADLTGERAADDSRRRAARAAGTPAAGRRSAGGCWAIVS